MLIKPSINLLSPLTKLPLMLSFILAVQILGLVTTSWDPECRVQCASQPLRTTTRRRSGLWLEPAVTLGLRGEGWPCPWHLRSERSSWCETAACGRELAGTEQAFLERAPVLGNAPQEWMVKGSLMAFIPSRKESGADMDSEPGLCFSHCCSWGGSWWDSCRSADLPGSALSG